MSIKRLSPDNIFRDMIDQQVERVLNVIIERLLYIGEQVLNTARQTNSYKDQTGNLRSSLGYVVAVEGQIVEMAGFILADKGTDRVTGQKEGIAYAEQLLKKFPTGIVLLVVAGMKYAQYVSAKGKDVLDSAELQADTLIKEMLEQLGITA